MPLVSSVPSVIEFGSPDGLQARLVASQCVVTVGELFAAVKISVALAESEGSVRAARTVPARRARFIVVSLCEWRRGAAGYH